MNNFRPLSLYRCHECGTVTAWPDENRPVILALVCHTCKRPCKADRIDAGPLGRLFIADLKASA